MAYLLDANVFISAKTLHYGFQNGSETRFRLAIPRIFRHDPRR